jgi:hypothetical protein
MSVYACPAREAACGEGPDDECREWKWQVRQDDVGGGSSSLIDCCLTQEQAEQAAEELTVG